MGVTVHARADVLKPSVPTEAAAKQAMQLLALRDLLCRTDEVSKHLAFLSGR